MKAWMLIGLVAPVLAVAPFTLPVWGQTKGGTEAASKEILKEPVPDEAATVKEQQEVVKERQKRTIINDVMRCPKRPTDQQFRTYNLLNDQVVRLKQKTARQKAAERRLADLRRQILAQRDELLKLQRLLDEKLTDKELSEAEARAKRIRKLVKILEVMQPQAGAQTATGLTMDLLVELLLRMKPKKAAGILSLVPGPLSSRTFEEVSNRRKGLIEALLERVEGQ